MTLRTDLHEYVRDQLDVPVTRVRLPRRPVHPSIHFRNVSASTIPTHSGPAGLVTKRIQWDVWSNNDDDLDALSERLRHLLDGYSGVMGDTDIGAIFFDSEVDIDEAPTTSEPQVYHRAIDFMVTYREAQGGS